MRIPVIVSLLLLATLPAAYALTRVTELPDGNVLIEIDGEKTAANADRPTADAASHPGEMTVGAGASLGTGAATLPEMEQEIGRLTREREQITKVVPAGRNPADDYERRAKLDENRKKILRLKEEMIRRKVGVDPLQ